MEKSITILYDIVSNAFKTTIENLADYYFVSGIVWLCFGAVLCVTTCICCRKLIKYIDINMERDRYDDDRMFYKIITLIAAVILFVLGCIIISANIPSVFCSEEIAIKNLIQHCL